MVGFFVYCATFLLVEHEKRPSVVNVWGGG